jgi:hypothetical protein
MTEFKCDTRSHGNFLYGKKQSVFTVLYRLYNHCYVWHKFLKIGMSSNSSNHFWRISCFTDNRIYKN